MLKQSCTLSFTSRYALLMHLFIMGVSRLFAQTPSSLAVADQTFSVSGKDEYSYAFLEGDQVQLKFQMLTGRKMKAVELVQYPSTPIYKAYEVDSAFEKTIRIPATGIYFLRFSETGLSKKVCRFTLHRTPEHVSTSRFDTRVLWDFKQMPQYCVKKRPVSTGKRLEVVSISGQTTVPASKMGLKSPIGVYQFVLPPHTIRWAYRVAVGQSAMEARNRDTQKLSQAIKGTAVKMMGYEPQTALAAYALGMTLDLTTSTSGEDVAYVLCDDANAQNYKVGKPYQAFLEQTGISVDAQRRYHPLEGGLSFLFKNDNWVDDITVSVDIEAVTEVETWGEEIYLEPVRP